MITWLLVLVIFTMFGYMLTICDYDELQVAGLIVIAVCLLTFVVSFVFYLVYFKRGEEK